MQRAQQFLIDRMRSYTKERFPDGLRWEDAYLEDDWMRMVCLCLDILDVSQGKQGRSIEAYGWYATLQPIERLLGDWEGERSVHGEDGQVEDALDLDEFAHRLWLLEPERILGSAPAIAFCPQLDDPKNASIATITLEEISLYSGGHQVGSFRYLSLSDTQSASARIHVADQFLHQACYPNVQMPPLRALDVKRKAGMQSEVRSMMEYIAERVRIRKTPSEQSLPPFPDASAAIAALMDATAGFSFFSNATAENMATGASFSGGREHLWGGDVLLLIGVSDTEIVYLEAQFDIWAE